MRVFPLWEPPEATPRWSNQGMTTNIRRQCADARGISRACIKHVPVGGAVWIERVDK